MKDKDKRLRLKNVGCGAIGVGCIMLGEGCRV